MKKSCEGQRLNRANRRRRDSGGGTAPIARGGTRNFLLSHLLSGHLQGHQCFFLRSELCFITWMSTETVSLSCSKSTRFRASSPQDSKLRTTAQEMILYSCGDSGSFGFSSWRKKIYRRNLSRTSTGLFLTPKTS